VDRFGPYFTRPAEYGLERVRPLEAYAFVYPFEPEVLGRLAYYFEFDHPSGDSVEEYARPAVEKVEVWQSARVRGCLKGTIQNDSLVLVDTRKRGKKLTTVLQEPLRTAYIFCDQSRAFSEIKAHLSACFPERPFTETWLEQALDGLLSRGLMLKDGKSYLSLAFLPLPSTLVDSRVAAAEAQAVIGISNLVQLGGFLQSSGNRI
jgi:hypothetical protein